MIDNERRADLGESAVMAAAVETNVAQVEDAETAVRDVLAYIAHFCDRLGLDPDTVFRSALGSYEGDFDDGPPAKQSLDAEAPLAEQVAS